MRVGPLLQSEQNDMSDNLSMRKIGQPVYNLIMGVGPHSSLANANDTFSCVREREARPAFALRGKNAAL